MPPRKKKRKLAPPDWHSPSRSSGGKPGDFWAIPEPWIWRFPNDKGCRRDVDAEITSWRGISIGASHFYAKIEVEQQQIWDPREVTWRRFDSGVHRNFAQEKYSADLLSRKAAIDFIELVIRRFYMGPEYRIKNMYVEGASGEEGLQALLKQLREED
jgi:hypothetical protein